MQLERWLSILLIFAKVPCNIQIFIISIFAKLMRLKSSADFSLAGCFQILRFSSLYKIDGTINLNAHQCYGNINTYPGFQKELEFYKDNIISLVDGKACKTFYKFGDGDYYFLKGQPCGSACPGKRAISKQYHEIDHQVFGEGVLKNDFITVEIYPENRKMFQELFPERVIDYPAEYAYGLVANKWFFKRFKGRIGLIGAREKLQLIRELMKYNQYKEYLGTDEFNDYICIPQKYACDDVNALEQSIGKQLSESNADIFLIGIGHVKSALLHRMKKYKKAVYIDVGSGIDAIAGCINIRWPYAGDWTNFRIRNHDYTTIDYFHYYGTGKHILLDRQV